MEVLGRRLVASGLIGLSAIIGLLFYRTNNTDQEALAMGISDTCVDALRTNRNQIPGSAKKIITECRSVPGDDLESLEGLVNREDDSTGLVIGLGSVAIILGAGMMNYSKNTA